MKLPYPNRAQWIIIWSAALLAFTHADYRFFTSLGGYDGDRWLWPGVSGYEVGFSDYDSRTIAAVLMAASLLVWQFSKPVSFRSPILLPLGFLLVCLAWYAVGAIRKPVIIDFKVSPEEFLKQEAEKDPKAKGRKDVSDQGWKIEK